MSEGRVWLKVSILLAAVASVIALIQIKKPGGIVGLFHDFGLLSSHWQAHSRLQWCKTRVKQLELIDAKLRLVQEGRKWVAYSPARRELNFVRVEKWLAENCDVAVEQLAPMPLVGLKKQLLARIQFIDQGTTELNQLGQDVFEWDGHFYRSQHWSAALAELAQLIEGDRS